MPPDTVAGADTPANANAGDTANASSSDIDARINRIITARLERQDKKLEQRFDQLTQILETIAKPKDAQEPVKQQAASNDASGDKLSLKTLQEQIASLNKGIQERDQRVKEAEQKARDVRLRSDVQSHFARHLGADSPHLRPYVNEFMSQFTDMDGHTVRMVKNDYGEPQHIPVASAVDELFKGELNHLVKQSKASALPRPGQQLTGNPFQLQTQQEQPTGLNPILGEFARHYAQQGEASMANAIVAAQPQQTSKPSK